MSDMKAEKAAGQQVSESDTETENGMNPPEVRAGDDYETPHPEGITSICYSCTEYETSESVQTRKWRTSTLLS